MRLYVLLRLDRWVFSGMILAIVFAALVTMGALQLGPFREIAQDVGAIQNIFSSMFGPIITGVTLVATIGQLVLSQELGAVGDQRERMQDAMSFRRDIESQAELDVSPPEPAAFLREVVAATEDSVEHLREVVAEERDEELRRSVDSYVESLDQNAEAVREKIENAQFAPFDVIWAALDFNYSWKIFQARQLTDEYETSLSE